MSCFEYGTFFEIVIFPERSPKTDTEEGQQVGLRVKSKIDDQLRIEDDGKKLSELESIGHFARELLA